MPKPYTAPAPFSDEQPLVINMTPVESNQVAAIGYDPETKTLGVTFVRGGALYQYPDVEPKVHAAFVGAESIGKFLLSQSSDDCKRSQLFGRHLQLTQTGIQKIRHYSGLRLSICTVPSCGNWTAHLNSEFRIFKKTHGLRKMMRRLAKKHVKASHLIAARYLHQSHSFAESGEELDASINQSQHPKSLCMELNRVLQRDEHSGNVYCFEFSQVDGFSICLPLSVAEQPDTPKKCNCGANGLHPTRPFRLAHTGRVPLVLPSKTPVRCLGSKRSNGSGQFLGLNIHVTPIVAALATYPKGRAA